MIAVSQCLLGVNCKYNGGNNLDKELIQFLEKEEYIAICPEVMGGLPIPRVPCEIVGDCVKSKDGRDFTKEYKKGAEIAVEKCKKYGVTMAILQARSPSCGCGTIYNGNFSGTLIMGDGITTKRLKSEGITVVDSEHWKQEYYSFYSSPVGTLLLVATKTHILRVEFFKENMDLKQWIQEEIPLIKEAKKQLDEYFLGQRQEFTLPLWFRGTEFQNQVWKALCEIPYGETRSYQEIAIQVGCEKGSQAVGQANGKNPIVILAPCHRVIGKKGTLVGYTGGMEKKQYLLELEQNYGKNNK